MNRQKSFFFLVMFLCGISAWGNNVFRISGKLRVLHPTTLQVTDLNGQVILQCDIPQDGSFSTEEKEIIPDVYTLRLGNTSQMLYLENSPIIVKGYFDEQNPDRSSLSFSGIEPFLTLQDCLPAEKDPDKAIISPEVRSRLTPAMAAALACLANVNDYASNKMLLDMIPEAELSSLSAQWLVKRVEVQSHHQLGVMCPDFTFVDADGKDVSLSDFRGKTVVLDFCASWCGPCRKEMRNMLAIYNELKNDKLEFISVSLDDDEAKWRKMLDEERLPWVMLWDKEGFPKDGNPNAIQTAYGFYAIPFVVVIDESGRQIARDVRGSRIREILLKTRN